MSTRQTASASAPSDGIAFSADTRANASTRARANAAQNALVLSAYALLIFLTRTLDQGDTTMYAGNVVKRLRGLTDDFWEFGHPLWRPLAFTLFACFTDRG